MIFVLSQGCAANFGDAACVIGGSSFEEILAKLSCHTIMNIHMKDSTFRLQGEKGAYSNNGIYYYSNSGKFYIDGDREYPTICGTGMEDYVGGSWSFAAPKEMLDEPMIETTYYSLYMGYPFYSNRDTAIRNPYHNDDCPPMRGLYRWHLPDPVFFDRDLKVTVQQIGVGYGGLFERQDDVCSTAYWYQCEPHTAFPKLPGVKERWPR